MYRKRAGRVCMRSHGHLTFITVALRVNERRAVAVAGQVSPLFPFLAKPITHPLAVEKAERLMAASTRRCGYATQDRIDDVQ